MSKISFDTVTRIISIIALPDLIDGENVISLDIATELYSQGKIDWVTDETLRKLNFPITATGGDTLPGSKDLGSTYFIAPDWKIAPYEGDHRFLINGNFYSTDGTSPFNRTIGNYNVFLEQTVSSLVDTTVSQLEEIEHSSFNNGITIDVLNGISGTTFPIGTPRVPVNNLTDLHLILEERGFTKIFVIGNLTISNEANWGGHEFIGESASKTAITVEPIANVTGVEFYEAYLYGTLDGNSQVERCVLDTLNHVEGFIHACMLNPGLLTLPSDNTKTVHFLSCYSGVPGSGTPTLNMGGDGTALAIRDYSGGIKLTNKTGNSSVSIDLNSGQAILDNTVISGEIVCRGTGKLIDINGEHIPTGSWNGCTIINETSEISFNDISYITKNVYINTELGINGNGKESTPFNNISDAVDYAESRGWKRLMFLADATLERTLKNFTIEGIGLPTIDFNGQNVDKSEFIKVKLTGLQVGSITAREVVMLDGMSGVNGIYKESGIAGDITMADNSLSTFASVSVLFLGSPSPYCIDLGLNTTNVILNVRKMSGAIEVKNCNTPTKFATFDFSGGKFIAGVSNTSGVIGIASLPASAVNVDLANSTKIIDGVFPSAETNRDALLYFEAP